MSAQAPKTPYPIDQEKSAIEFPDIQFRKGFNHQVIIHYQLMKDLPFLLPFVELKKFLSAWFKSFKDCCNGILETSDNHSLYSVFL